MQTTVETSSLIQHRANTVVPLRMKQMEEAILHRDFQTFGRLTMMVSNDVMFSIKETAINYQLLASFAMFYQLRSVNLKL